MKPKKYFSNLREPGFARAIVSNQAKRSNCVNDYKHKIIILLIHEFKTYQLLELCNY